VVVTRDACGTGLAAAADVLVGRSRH
jgi:hypothetical protein